MTLSPNLRRQRLRNLLARLGNDESLVKEYLRRVAPATAAALLVDPRVVEAVLSEWESRKASQPPASKSPLYQAPLLCPGHLPLGPFQGWFSLGHQQIEENLLGVPRTLGGLDGYARVDPVLLEAQVCPECFYASPFRQDFGKPGSAGPDRSPGVLAALASPGAREARARMAGPQAGAFGDAARGPETARTAFDLALASARTARQAGETAAAYKEAHIRLRLARLEEDAGRSGDALAQYEAALEDFLAYRSVELPAEILARTCRQIVALGVLLGRDPVAAQERSFLFESRTRAARRENTEDLAAYTRHFTRADEIWQDRERHRLGNSRPTA